MAHVAMPPVMGTFTQTGMIPLEKSTKPVGVP
jgi:hypothetical protein